VTLSLEVTYSHHIAHSYSGLNSFFVRSSGFVGFEVLTAVALKSSVFWAIAPCSPLMWLTDIGRLSEARNQHEENKTKKQRTKKTKPRRLEDGNVDWLSVQRMELCPRR
jgi:hypothetical protein